MSLGYLCRKRSLSVIKKKNTEAVSSKCGIQFFCDGSGSQSIDSSAMMPQVRITEVHSHFPQEMESDSISTSHITFLALLGNTHMHARTHTYTHTHFHSHSVCVCVCVCVCARTDMRVCVKVHTLTYTSLLNVINGSFSRYLVFLL